MGTGNLPLCKKFIWVLLLVLPIACCVYDLSLHLSDLQSLGSDSSEIDHFVGL